MALQPSPPDLVVIVLHLHAAVVPRVPVIHCDGRRPRPAPHGDRQQRRGGLLGVRRACHELEGRRAGACSVQPATCHGHHPQPATRPAPPAPSLGPCPAAAAATIPCPPPPCPPAPPAHLMKASTVAMPPQGVIKMLVSLISLSCSTDGQMGVEGDGGGGGGGGAVQSTAGSRDRWRCRCRLQASIVGLGQAPREGCLSARAQHAQHGAARTCCGMVMPGCSPKSNMLISTRSP